MVHGRALSVAPAATALPVAPLPRGAAGGGGQRSVPCAAGMVHGRSFWVVPARAAITIPPFLWGYGGARSLARSFPCHPLLVLVHRSRDSLLRKLRVRQRLLHQGPDALALGGREPQSAGYVVGDRAE